MAIKVKQYEDMVAGPLAPEGSFNLWEEAQSFRAWTIGRRT